MESTSCKENCPFVKQGFCSSYKECPNHIETWWIPDDESQPTKLEDCSPKRLVLQQQLMQARFDLTTKALVESRNEYNKLNTYLTSLIENARNVVEQNKLEVDDEKTISIEHDRSIK